MKPRTIKEEWIGYVIPQKNHPNIATFGYFSMSEELPGLQQVLDASK